jgi:hypothetical protein
VHSTWKIQPTTSPTFVFSVLQVSAKSRVMKENCCTVVLVVVHRVFYSHFIILLKKYDMVATTFLYIIIIFCYVNKLNSSMSNFGGRLSQPKKSKLLLGISFFCQHNSIRWWIFDFETDYTILMGCQVGQCQLREKKSPTFFNCFIANRFQSLLITLYI